MNLLQITAKADAYAPKDEDRDLVAPHAAIHLRVFVDRKEFGCSHTLDASAVIDGNLLLATSEFGGDHFILTCVCGIPECSGIYKTVQVRRTEALVEWAFPAEYAEYLTARGFDERQFRFDRKSYDATLHSIYEFVTAAEVLLRLPACIGEPVFFSGDSFATQMARERTHLVSPG
jgi:hypothetical protein